MKQELAGSHRRPYLMQIKALDHELGLLIQVWLCTIERDEQIRLVRVLKLS